MNKCTECGSFFVELLVKTGALDSIKNDPLLISEKLIEVGGVSEPNYTNWFARKKWTILEASCLFHGIDMYIYEEVNRDFSTDTPSGRHVSTQEVLVACKLRSLMNNIYKKAEVMLTWIPKHSHAKSTGDIIRFGTEAEEDPLKLINTHLLTVGSIPKKLLMYAKENFLLLYQSRDATEDTRKNWKDNWHTIAPSFKALIDKSTKIKQDISPRKEETLLALIGILTDKYFTGSKYKKPDGLHKTSTIAEDIINHISKQLPDNHIPHGFKKSNLIEIISNSLDCWNKKKES